MSMHPRAILIVGPAWIGDMIMAQSLFKLLKERHPNVQLDVLAPAWTFSLLQSMPEVSQAIVMPLQHKEVQLRQRWAIGKSLRDQYDQAIVLPNSFKSALIPWVAHIKKRTGWLGESRYFLLNDYRRLDKKKYPLMVEQYLALGLPPDESLPLHYPIPSFQISKATETHIINKFLGTPPKRPILGLSVGAAFGSSKRWPLDYFKEVAAHMQKKGWDIWLFGSEADRNLTTQIQSHIKEHIIDFSGTTDLHETIVLLSLTTGMVTNDSGLMHMAAALQKPLVALYGSTSPHFTPPLSSKAQVLQLTLSCQPCFKRECPLTHHRCMQDLKPALVLAAISKWEQSHACFTH